MASTDPRRTGLSAAGVTSSTWAAKPASADATALYLMTDVGESGSLWRYANSRWKSIAGQAMLKTLVAPVSGIAAAETIALQTLLPAAGWQTNDVLRIWVALEKSGSTDTGLLTVRIGTAGTTADTAITGLSANAIMVAGTRCGGWFFDVKLLSATSARRVGGNAAGEHSYMGRSTVAIAAATAISDASTNPLYLSVGLNSGGATDTLTLQSASFQLMTP